MLRPPRTARLLFLLAFTFASVGCSTLYRPIYSPGKTNYKRPPEKKEAVADLLPPATDRPGVDGLPVPPAGGAAAPAPIPGMLDAAPAIPGLPQP